MNGSFHVNHLLIPLRHKQPNFFPLLPFYYLIKMVLPPPLLVLHRGGHQLNSASKRGIRLSPHQLLSSVNQSLQTLVYEYKVICEIYFMRHLRHEDVAFALHESLEVLFSFGDVTEFDGEGLRREEKIWKCNFAIKCKIA